MYKLVIIVFLLAGLSLSSNAKALAVSKHLKEIPKVLKEDSSKIKIRTFNKAALDDYKKQPEFKYHTEANDSESWWDRFWRWFWHMIENLFSRPDSHGVLNPAFKYLLVILFIGLLVYILMKAAGVPNIFNREAKRINVNYSESLENIHDIVFDDEIEKAIASRDYRLAVRLLYLSCLKKLNDAGVINWQIEKTNSDYLNEITNAGKKNSFGLLTRQFEYIWYGDFPVDGQSFQKINSLFVDFTKIIQ